MQLQLHLPNMHMVSFAANQDLNDVISREGISRTMLTAYFEANRTVPDARGLLYKDLGSKLCPEGGVIRLLDKIKT